MEAFSITECLIFLTVGAGVTPGTSPPEPLLSPNGHKPSLSPAEQTHQPRSLQQRSSTRGLPHIPPPPQPTQLPSAAGSSSPGLAPFRALGRGQHWQERSKGRQAARRGSLPLQPPPTGPVPLRSLSRAHLAPGPQRESSPPSTARQPCCQATTQRGGLPAGEKGRWGRLPQDPPPRRKSAGGGCSPGRRTATMGSSQGCSPNTGPPPRQHHLPPQEQVGALGGGEPSSLASRATQTQLPILEPHTLLPDTELHPQKPPTTRDSSVAKVRKLLAKSSPPAWSPSPSQPCSADWPRPKSPPRSSPTAPCGPQGALRDKEGSPWSGQPASPGSSQLPSQARAGTGQTRASACRGEG